MSIDTGLRRAREAAGLTQTDLGVAVGVTPQMINRIEAGTKLPSLPLTAAIAEALGTTVDELLHSKEDRA